MKAAPDIAPPWRMPLLALGFACLLAGVGAGLFRLGWSVPLFSTQQVALHGPLMVSGFFGTVIALERAVALARRWAYLGPLASGLGGLALGLGVAPAAGQLLLALGSLILLAASLHVYLRQRALFTFTLALGAACWAVGNLLWLGGLPVPAVVPWWAGFLVLTIAGERLELSRFLPPSRMAQRLFALIVALLVAGMGWSAMSSKAGDMLLAAAQAVRGQFVERRCRDRTAEGADLTEADIIEQDEHHVGSPLGRCRYPRPVGCGFLVGLADCPAKFGFREGKLGAVDHIARTTGRLFILGIPCHGSLPDRLSL